MHNNIITSAKNIGDMDCDHIGLVSIAVPWDMKGRESPGKPVCQIHAYLVSYVLTTSTKNAIIIIKIGYIQLCFIYLTNICLIFNYVCIIIYYIINYIIIIYYILNILNILYICIIY